MDRCKLSVCIPAYDMGGNGARYLAESFSRLERQTLDGFEVVVADQSEADAVSELCRQWSGRLAIRHVWNRGGVRNASANCNAALGAARGEVLKILFQDDLIVADDALEMTWQALAGGSPAWLLAGSAVTRDGHDLERPMQPRPDARMHFGRNTVSSPSVLALHSGCRERFDEALVWLMDVEFYKRLWDAHGDPVILDAVQIANRLHPGQVSATVTPRLRRTELDHVWRRHGASTSLAGRLEYLRQRLKASLPRASSRSGR